MKQVLGPTTKVVMTGGWAEFFSKQEKANVYHEPDLVLDGLRLLYEKNRR